MVQFIVVFHGDNGVHTVCRAGFNLNPNFFTVGVCYYGILWRRSALLVFVLHCYTSIGAFEVAVACSMSRQTLQQMIRNPVAMLPSRNESMTPNLGEVRKTPSKIVNMALAPGPFFFDFPLVPNILKFFLKWLENGRYCTTSSKWSSRNIFSTWKPQVFFVVVPMGLHVMFLFWLLLMYKGVVRILVLVNYDEKY